MAVAGPEDRVLTVPNVITVVRLLCLPVFLWLKERAQPQRLPPGENYFSVAFAQLRETVRTATGFREFMKFMLAFLIYNEGVIMALDFAAILGAVLFGLEQTGLIVFFIVVQATNVIGALVFGSLQDRFGGKRSLTLSILLMVACIVAMYLARFGSVVYLVHRRDALRASKIMAERALSNPKIKPVWDSVVTEILDVKQDKVTGVRLRNVKTQAESLVECAGVFVAIGHLPNTQLFKGVLEMDESGYILPRQGTATSVPGVFVAGDCADRVYRQAVTAAGLGCAAAIEAERYLAARHE